MKKERVYSLADVIMVLASRVAAKNFSDNISELSTYRTNWTPLMATGLVTKVDFVATDLLGANTKTKLFNATANLEAMIDPAHRDLGLLKQQIDVDFIIDPAKKSAILNDLGFTGHFSKIHNRNQSELIALLLLFSRNISAYQDEIIAKGTSKTILDRISGYAKVIIEANTLQEQLKTSTKNVTKETVKKLNDLYTEVMGICKIASGFYNEDPVKKEMFTFSTIVRNLGLARPAKKDSGTPEK